MNLIYIFLDAAPAAASGGGLGDYSMIIMMVALFAIMYFFMIRPQQKKQKKLQEQRNALAVGDKIVTAGGVHGRIKDVKDTTFVIEIAEGTRITIEKTSVFASSDSAVPADSSTLNTTK